MGALKIATKKEYFLIGDDESSEGAEMVNYDKLRASCHAMLDECPS